MDKPTLPPWTFDGTGTVLGRLPAGGLLKAPLGERPVVCRDVGPEDAPAIIAAPGMLNLLQNICISGCVACGGSGLEHDPPVGKPEDCTTCRGEGKVASRIFPSQLYRVLGSLCLYR